MDELEKENGVLRENLDVYKEEVENMMELLGKIEGQVDTLEKENDELAEELDSLKKQVDSERESYKDLKEQYLDQIELNNRRNKEIIMLKNQLSRKNDLGDLNRAEPGKAQPEQVRVLEAEVMDKNEVINMLKGEIRDKESQKSHLSQKIRDLEVLFRDMERENQELRKLKDVGTKEGDDKQTQLYVQIIRQQQIELKKWRASQLTPEEVPKLQIIIQDQHKEILLLKSKLKNDGKPVPEVNQSQLMEVIRKQQAEINRLKLKVAPSSEDLEDPKEKVQRLMQVVREQQDEINRLRQEKGGEAEKDADKIQQLMKVIKQQQDEVKGLRDQLSSEQSGDNEQEAKIMQYVQVIKQQRDEINRLKQRPPQANGDRLAELESQLESKNDEIFFLRKKLNEGGGPRVESGNPGNNEEYLHIISGQNAELERLKMDLLRAQGENEHLRANGQNTQPNTQKMMEIIQKQQNELNQLRMEKGGSGNSEDLMNIIQKQQDELNQLRLMQARNGKVEDMMQRLKEKQDEINRLRMETAGMQTNQELIKMVKEKQNQINRLQKEKGNQESVERLMELVRQKQDEINELRMNRKGQENNKKLMQMLKEKQDEINSLRMERAQSENNEELKRIIQQKQDEINQLKNQSGGRSPNDVRKEIELQNEISRLKPFESRSQQLENIVNDLEAKIFELQTANPQVANSQRMGDIIKRQQDEINRLKMQLGGRDWASEAEKLREQVTQLRQNNEVLKANFAEVQNVNKSNKEIYLHEKETLVKEIHTLKKEVEIREERIEMVRVQNDTRTEELESEVRELSMMVNQVMQSPDQYEEKYREQKAINTNWRKKAEDYDNLKQLYEQKLLENEAKIIRLNNLELKMFVLLTQLRTKDPNFKPSPVSEQPVLYQGPNRFHRRTASPNVQSGYRKSSPLPPGNYGQRTSQNRGSNPLKKRVTRDSYRQNSPSPSPTSKNVEGLMRRWEELHDCDEHGRHVDQNAGREHESCDQEHASADDQLHVDLGQGKTLQASVRVADQQVSC